MTEGLLQEYQVKIEKLHKMIENLKFRDDIVSQKFIHLIT
jgi:hypothetical protein